MKPSIVTHPHPGTPPINAVLQVADISYFIPSDVLAHIFTFAISHIGEFIPLREVCQNWQVMIDTRVDSLWGIFFKQHFPNCEICVKDKDFRNVYMKTYQQNQMSILNTQQYHPTTHIVHVNSLIEDIQIIGGKIVVQSLDFSVSTVEVKEKCGTQTADSKQLVLATAYQNKGGMLARYQEQIISGGGDGSIISWDSKTGKLLHTLKKHTKPIQSLWVEDGKVIALSSKSEGGFAQGFITISDAATGELLDKIIPEKFEIYPCPVQMIDKEHLLVTHEKIIYANRSKTNPKIEIMNLSKTENITWTEQGIRITNLTTGETTWRAQKDAYWGPVTALHNMGDLLVVAMLVKKAGSLGQAYIKFFDLINPTSSNTYCPEHPRTTAQGTPFLIYKFASENNKLVFSYFSHLSVNATYFQVVEVDSHGTVTFSNTKELSMEMYSYDKNDCKLEVGCYTSGIKIKDFIIVHGHVFFNCAIARAHVIFTEGMILKNDGKSLQITDMLISNHRSLSFNKVTLSRQAPEPIVEEVQAVEEVQDEEVSRKRDRPEPVDPEDETPSKRRKTD